jgi:hypothetical protein
MIAKASDEKFATEVRQQSAEFSTAESCAFLAQSASSTKAGGGVCTRRQVRRDHDRAVAWRVPIGLIERATRRPIRSKFDLAKAAGLTIGNHARSAFRSVPRPVRPPISVVVRSIQN